MKRKLANDPGGDRISWNNFRTSPSFTSAVTYLKERYKVYLQNQAEKNRQVTISSKPLGAMVNLRLLQMNFVNLEGSLKFLPAELKWLQLKYCPLKSLPSVLFLRRLAALDLSDSKVESLSGGHRNKVGFTYLTQHHCQHYCDNWQASTVYTSTFFRINFTILLFLRHQLMQFGYIFVPVQLDI